MLPEPGGDNPWDTGSAARGHAADKDELDGVLSMRLDNSEPIIAGTRLRITVEPITNPPNLKPLTGWTFYTADTLDHEDDPAHDLFAIEACVSDECRGQMTLTNEVLGAFAAGTKVIFQPGREEEDSLVSETGIHYQFLLALTNALPVDGRVVIEWPADWPQSYEPSERFTVECLTRSLCGYDAQGLQSDADVTGVWLSSLTFTDSKDSDGNAYPMVFPGGAAGELLLLVGAFTNPAFSGSKTFTVRTESLDALGALWGIDESTDPFTLDFTTGVLTITSVLPTIPTIASVKGAYTIAMEAQHAPQATDELVISWPLTFPLQSAACVATTVRPSGVTDLITCSHDLGTNTTILSGFAETPAAG